MKMLRGNWCRKVGGEKQKLKSFAQKVAKKDVKIVCVEMEAENETGKCLWLRRVKMKLGATTSNSGFKKWLILSFLVGKYSTGKLYIFTTNYKVVATS